MQNYKQEKVISDRYKRVGAQYVCRDCKKKFFTREDIEKCTDSASCPYKDE